MVLREEHLGENFKIPGPLPDFHISFHTMLEQVRMDKRRHMEVMIEIIQTEMALERILG